LRKAFSKNYTKRLHRTVGLPCRTNPPNLGPSRNIAVKRFYSVENKLKKDKFLYWDYKSLLEDYEARGHLEYLSENISANLPATHTYFLPHPVFKPESTTTKLRVVFDGSCRSTIRNFKISDDNLSVSLSDIPEINPKCCLIMLPVGHLGGPKPRSFAAFGPNFLKIVDAGRQNGHFSTCSKTRRLFFFRAPLSCTKSLTVRVNRLDYETAIFFDGVHLLPRR
jgi:hypothetical protein